MVSVFHISTRRTQRVTRSDAQQTRCTTGMEPQRVAPTQPPPLSSALGAKLLSAQREPAEALPAHLDVVIFGKQ